MADPPAASVPDAVVFDLDGTLVDTVETRIAAWREAFREAGIPADRSHVTGLIGADGVFLAREVARRDGRDIDDEQAQALDRRSGELYDRLNDDPRPLPGASQLLEELTRRGLPWVIATSSRPEQVTASVAALGLSRRPAIVDGGRVERAKPAPDLLLAAAAELGARPEAVWAVGDSRWDMLSAAAAGMHPVGVTTGQTTREDLEAAGGRLVVASLGELRERLHEVLRTAGKRDDEGAESAAEIAPGFAVYGADGVKVGEVDAVFADYLLVRAGFPPVDVHVPTGTIAGVDPGAVALEVPAALAADGRWDRPPMRPHGDGLRSGADDNPR